MAHVIKAGIGTVSTTPHFNSMGDELESSYVPGTACHAVAQAVPAGMIWCLRMDGAAIQGLTRQ